MTKKDFTIRKRLNRGKLIAGMTACFFALTSLLSCANGIDDTGSDASYSGSETVLLTGNLDIYGAVPEAFTKTDSKEITGRSALPSNMEGTEYCIKAVYTNQEGISEEIKGSVDQTEKTYTIGLTINRTYTVTASLKKTLTDGQQITVMEDIWEDVKPARANPALTHDFILKPVKEGKGSIKLDMTLPSGTSLVLGGDEISPAPEVSVTGTSATITGSDIPAGTYNITINFYKTSGTNKFLLYSIPQIINVFAGMETNTWQDDGSSNSPISGGKFVLTDEIIKNYQRTIFYVSEKDFTGKDIPAGQTRTGSPYAPFASLSDALNTITNNNKAEDYRIFIGGSVKGCTTISSSTKAKSITIEGFTGNSEDILDGNGEGRVLQVSTEVPLTIKNLKITGGKAEGSGEPGKGGGIFVAYKANVILDSGALVGDETETLASSESYGNRAEVSGGGIYVDAGTLILKKGSKVCRNYAGSNDSDTDSGGGGIASMYGKITIEEGAYVSYNKTCGRGGGIWLIGGNSASILTMNGGEISHNETEYWGGGLLVGSVAGYQGESCPVKFYFKGGEICNNKSTSEDYNWGVGGGGVTVDHSYMEMSGSAKIHDNESKNAGGGLRIGSNSVFLMSGGEIYDNTCSREKDSDGITPISGGGLDIEPNSKVVISGSAKIPYGFKGDKGYRKNDIWLRYADDGATPSYSYITVGGALSSTFEMGIGVKGKHGLLLAQADGTNVTDLTPYKDYFNLIKDDWLLNLSDNKKKLVLDAPIYVAGNNHQVCTADGSADGTGEKSAPFDTIEHACSVMNDSTVMYTILVDGELSGEQIIPAGVNAAYITLKGASGNTSDIINANAEDHLASALTIALSSTQAADIQNLTIKGGYAENGGGINIGQNAVVFLGDDLKVTGNTASGHGGGVYAPNGVNVSGNVEITGNTDSANKDSNLYLPHEKKVNITGALTNGSKKAQIGISTADEPSLTSTVAFTLDYEKYNSGVAPGTYFTGDKWNVAWGSGTSAGQAVLAASGGNITIEPIYEDITISADKTKFAKDTASKVITFTAKGVNSEGQQVTLPIGTGEGKVSLTYSVSYHGDPVPEESGSTSYYTTDTNTLTLGDALPLGAYTVSLTAIYNGKTYSAGFEVKIVEMISYTTSEAITLIAGMSGENTIKIVDSNIDGLVNAIKTRYSKDNTFKVNLDLSDLSVTSVSLATRHGIKSIILPTSLTSFSREDVAHDAGEDIEAFIISEENSKYRTVDGVIYTKDMTQLILYPKNKPDDEFTIPDSVTSLGSNAFNMANFSKLNGLSHIQHVSSQPFYNAKNLKEADFSGLQDTTFPSYCFEYVKTLEKVILSDKITKIGINSFSTCDNLKEVHFLSVEPPVLSRGNNIAEFAGCSSKLKFYVPAGSKSNYTSSSNFTNSQYNRFAGSGLADRIIEE
ncbi:hypothetical protein MSI_03340 [Treponema sp. JC4]|uniref:leucine-rich repeat domain-containing protein n=1 Tax=Treponema sp. JC4 TaxID=1124982 RepID=UPI00025B09E7|nr:leucine-rich repeat domain-containing protein [Treponema sp. JC4]EID85906.1 hypothetical protein MSI_03340 [Treponema sp. JC4]